MRWQQWQQRQHGQHAQHGWPEKNGLDGTARCASIVNDVAAAALGTNGSLARLDLGWSIASCGSRMACCGDRMHTAAGFVWSMPPWFEISLAARSAAGGHHTGSIAGMIRDPNHDFAWKALHYYASRRYGWLARAGRLERDRGSNLECNAFSVSCRGQEKFSVMSQRVRSS
jgi:hypothetical protein